MRQHLSTILGNNKDSANAEDFKAYLAKYPDGQFTALAKNRIKNLEVTAKPAEPEPTSRNSGAAELPSGIRSRTARARTTIERIWRNIQTANSLSWLRIGLHLLEAAEKDKVKADLSSPLILMPKSSPVI